MLTLDSQIATLIAGYAISGVHWLVEIALPGGTAYFADSGQITWNGHTWLPYLDPDGPVDGIKQNIKCDEKQEVTITLVNVTHAISDSVHSNDFHGCSASIYIYFASISKAVKVFNGWCGKPESLTDTAVSIPITSYLHGPRVKLPGRRFAITCAFTFDDGKRCPYTAHGTPGFTTCPGSRKACQDRGMAPPDVCTYTFADGVDCLYDPPDTGVVDTKTGLPFTSCGKRQGDCARRGMTADGPFNVADYFGGFQHWTHRAHGILRNTGFLGIGRKSYASNAEIQDNFLGGSVPLVYGRIKVPGIPFFFTDESEWLLVGAFLAEGQVYGLVDDDLGNDMVYANGVQAHNFTPFFAHGWPGQTKPVVSGYSADPFCCTAYVLLRITDEVGLQAGKQVDVSAVLDGRLMRQYIRDVNHWDYNEDVYTNSPPDVLIDLICNPDGCMGQGYARVNPDVCFERDYSDAEITDVDGVTRKRYTLNGAIFDSQTAGDVLERIRDEFQLWYRDYGDSVSFGFVKPSQTSQRTFSAASHNLQVDEDTWASRVEIWEAPADETPNTLHVSFLDEDNGWEKTTFTLRSEAQIEKAGKKVEESIYLGYTTNIGQALRVSANWMERAISGNWFARWVSPLLGAMDVEVGDVITLVDALVPGGTDTFLVTSKEISAEFDITFEGRLFRSTFWDDTAEEEFADLVRGEPENQFRLPDESTNLQAVELISEVEGKTVSRIAVAWDGPDDPLYKESEVWYRDTSSPDQSWIQAAISYRNEARFDLPLAGYRMLEIRVRSISRYGIFRPIDSTDVPEIDLLVDGTTDSNVPAAPANLQVQTRSDDASIPPGMFRVKFDAGASNWASVDTLYIEAHGSLPFSDGTQKTSNGNAVAGTGTIEAGGLTITKTGAGWTPGDSALVGCIAKVTDGTGNVQARMVTGNTADTVTASGPWYLPDGNYSFEVTTDFTQENYRGWMFTKAAGQFSPSARSFSFDLPVSEVSLYFRVAAFNAYGISAWSTTASPKLATAVLIDTTPASLVTGFGVTADAFTAPDGSQRVQCIFAWTDPSPKGNYGHLLVMADVPDGAGGYKRQRIGEYWNSGESVILPSTATAVKFYAIAVNNAGYYAPDWYTRGEGSAGGYQKVEITLTANNTAPSTPSSIAVTYAAMSGQLNVTWTRVSNWDIAYYELYYRYGATVEALNAASYQSLNQANSTIHTLDIPPLQNGYYYQFRVRAVDNAGNNSGWKYSAQVQAYAAFALQPVAAPINLQITGSTRYEAGVPLIDVSVNWDNPADSNYGGCEVWLLVYDGSGVFLAGELWDRQDYDSISNTTLTVPADGRRVKFAVVPYNKGGLIPDYGTRAESSYYYLIPSAFATLTVPAPDITARDGIGCVEICAELPAWAGHQNPYEQLVLYICTDGNTTNAKKVASYAAGNISDGAEADTMKFTVPFKALEGVTGTWALGTQYHFFGKLADKLGNLSAFSADTDNTAVFISGNQTDAGAADFAASAEIMRFVAADRYINVSWFAPTVNGTTVYETQLQVATDNAFANLKENITVNQATGSVPLTFRENGTYYVRIRYRNNSAAGWSEWFGRIEGTAYAQVQTQAGQSGDSARIASTDIEYTTTEIPNTDGVQLDIRLKSTATNTLTCWNLYVVWSSTESKVKDESNIYASGFTATWADNDSWISVSTTPATAWIGRFIQWNPTGSAWEIGLITQIDATGKKVQIMGSFGAAQSGKTARVVTPLNMRGEGVYCLDVGAANNWKIEKNIYYSIPINQFAGGTTIYVRVIAVNVIGRSAPKDLNFALPVKSWNVATYGQGTVMGTAPTGTFSDSGYQWEVAANNTVDFVATGTYTNATDVNERADKLQVTWGTDKKMTFGIAAGATDYALKIPNLDPYTAYTFVVKAVKTTATGEVTSSASVTHSSVKYTTGTDLVLNTNNANGRVKVKYGTSYADIDVRNVFFSDDGYIQYAGNEFLLADLSDEGVRIRSGWIEAKCADTALVLTGEYGTSTSYGPVCTRYCDLKIGDAKSLVFASGDPTGGTTDVAKIYESADVLILQALATNKGVTITPNGTGQVLLNGDSKVYGKFGANNVSPSAKRTHVADPSGGSTVDSEARTAINSILATLEAFGFHATS